MGKKVNLEPKGEFYAEDDGGKLDETDSFFNQNLWIDIHHVPSGQFVEFKAFLTDFSDNYESSWNEEDVYGRNDPLLTFEGTRRDITMAWKVLAKDPVEARENLKRVSTFINFLYPHYDDRGIGGREMTDNSISATSLSAAPLLKIRMMNWMTDVSGKTRPHGEGRARDVGLLGKVDGFSFTPNLEEGMIWGDEIPEDFLDHGNPISYRMFPKEFEISIDFTVNHQHELGWSGKEPRQGAFPYGERIKETDEKQNYILVDDDSKNKSTDRQEKASQYEIGDDLLYGELLEEESGGAGGAPKQMYIPEN